MREIRRKDRVLENERAQELLHEGEYGFLAMTNADGGGYGIPISYVVDGDAVYFHCATEGHKIDNLAVDNQVTFTVVGATKVIPRQFTTAYESVMLFGRVVGGLSEQERMHALRLIVRKYSPEYEEIAEKYVTASFHRTEILKLNIESQSAKAKK